MRDLVCDRCPSFAPTDDRYAGKLLCGGRAVYSASSASGRAAGITGVGNCHCRRISGQFRLEVAARETAKPGKAGASFDEHFLLVVLQQHRRQRSRRHRVIRSIPRCAVPLARLDL